MKPATFDYIRPENLSDAVSLLSQGGGESKIKAGGQSLGPMLNMRLANTAQLVDISQIPDLSSTLEDNGSIVFGACITHAAIEDGRVPDVTNGMMTKVAAGIAYRAVRNQGTIGGSLAHADPAADWIITLIAAGAEIIILGPKGERRVELSQFMESAFETALKFDDILTAIRIPKFSEKARWGYYKFCRKTGEFANAMSAIVVDPARDVCRVVIGATDTHPVFIPDANQLLSSNEAINAAISKHGLDDDPLSAQMHRTALRRAIEQVR
jgi:carbon-monoxide dehydrogenase medium subunit